LGAASPFDVAGRRSWPHVPAAASVPPRADGAVSADAGALSNRVPGHRHTLTSAAAACRPTRRARAVRGLTGCLSPPAGSACEDGVTGPTITLAALAKRPAASPYRNRVNAISPRRPMVSAASTARRSRDRFCSASTSASKASALASSPASMAVCASAFRAAILGSSSGRTNAVARRALNRSAISTSLPARRSGGTFVSPS
jgi:hypothetical protein